MNEANQDIEKAAEHIRQVLDVLGQRIVGQRVILERLLMGLLSGGHILLEGLPGLAKTSAVKALADASDLTRQRIQFTPDLLPADVVGTQIYDPRQSAFTVKKGPIFTHLLIADEINRAPAKVQSALLEAMQERQVTLGETSFSLPKPFLVMATQNPIEQEGTYPLPEAQLDRFLFKLKMHYGSIEEEMLIVERMSLGEEIHLEKAIQLADIERYQVLQKAVFVSPAIRRYLVELVFATRFPARFGLKNWEGMVQVGASPRASINLEKAARLQAMFQGRSYVIPQDVKDIGLDVLRHRILLSYEAEAENRQVEEFIQAIFSQVAVP